MPARQGHRLALIPFALLLATPQLVASSYTDADRRALVDAEQIDVMTLSEFHERLLAVMDANALGVRYDGILARPNQKSTLRTGPVFMNRPAAWLSWTVNGLLEPEESRLRDLVLFRISISLEKQEDDVVRHVVNGKKLYLRVRDVNKRKEADNAIEGWRKDETAAIRKLLEKIKDDPKTPGK